MSLASESTLHCLYASPNSGAALRLLAQIAPREPVLLLSKAVLLADASHPQVPRWITSGAVIYALDEDLQAYAVTNVHAAITRTSYADWVLLSERCPTQTLWR
ncbi:DsrH/TusB family sulfur metabolism protein [Congregibacter variabilis]|uniref:DsrH/TusB family sulfur metabolism protein n=1 Tax=Congregibacter variabilis TaxID=3081200 RepID=A0ABZ0I6S7_9GAMM|nr:DsrH/TusB family sulfur metabolism protein [Congregibacter sp. IMCC43200]